jgi:hypothetical protein
MLVPVNAPRTPDRDDREDEDDRPRKRRPRDEDGGRDEPPARSRRTDDRDRPRKRVPAKARKSDGSMAGVWIVTGVTLLVLAGVGAGAVLLARLAKDRGNDTDAAGNTNVGGIPGRPGTPAPPPRPALPEGWVEFRHPEGYFEVYVPSRPHGRTSKTHWGSFDGPEIRTSEYTTTPTRGRTLICAMQVMDMPPDAAAHHRQALQTGVTDPQAMEFIRGFGVEPKITTMTWGGHAGYEMELRADFQKFFGAFPGGADASKQLYDMGKNQKDKDGKPLPGPPTGFTTVMRATMIGNRMYTFTIADLNGTPPPEADRRAFFDSFRPGK